MPRVPQSTFAVSGKEIPLLNLPYLQIKEKQSGLADGCTVKDFKDEEAIEPTRDKSFGQSGRKLDWGGMEDWSKKGHC